jgi:hypothetical protein
MRLRGLDRQHPDYATSLNCLAGLSIQSAEREVSKFFALGAQRLCFVILTGLDLHDV